MNNENITQKERELIIARLETVSHSLCFCSGNSSTITRDEMINHVRENDSIGQEFVKIELDFLRALKDGRLMSALVTA